MRTCLQETWDRRQMARMMRVLIFHDLEYRDGTPITEKDRERMFHENEKELRKR